MKRFIEDSQNLKGEIKSNPQIVEAIRSCFSGNSEPFAEGTEHQIYRLGKTNSGVYLVLRKKKFDIENETERFEIYCRNAEALAISKEKGLFVWRPNSPSFCIGVIYQEKEVGIITEDMSEGGKYQMENSMGSISSERMLDGNVIDEVNVDLDGCHIDYLRREEIIRESSYFSPEYVLEV